MSLPNRTAFTAVGAIVGALAVFILAGKLKCSRAKRETSDSVDADGEPENERNGTPKIYGSGAVGGAPTTPSLTAVEVARAAALKRQSDRAVLMSEGSLKAAEKKEKAAVIGKIEECYAKIDKVKYLAEGHKRFSFVSNMLVLMFTIRRIRRLDSERQSLNRCIGILTTSENR